MIKGIYGRKVCVSLSWILIMIVAVFAGFLNTKGYAHILKNMLTLAVMFSIGANLHKGKLVYCKKIPNYIVLWLVFLLFVFMSFNANTLGSMRIICGIIIALALMMHIEWIGCGKVILGVFTGVNVFFTLLFFVVPQLYTYVVKAYGMVPAGTSAGKAGYRAGIADHYSQNGIYISVFLILVVSEFLTCVISKERNRKKNVSLLLLSCVAMFALLLTSKRGVFVFALISIAFTYLISNKSKVTRTVKLLIALLIAIGIIQIVSEFIPEIGLVFERFQKMGEDGSTAERFAMWQLAVQKFLDNPILGNGFWSFREFYHKNLAHIFHYNDARFQYNNAHNVYLQVLCETGLVGASVYLSALTTTLKKTVEIVRHCEKLNFNLKSAALFSLTMQIFFAIYSFTGNCLFDVVFLFYVFALSITLCLEKNMRSRNLL